MDFDADNILEELLGKESNVLKVEEDKILRRKRYSLEDTTHEVERRLETVGICSCNNILKQISIKLVNRTIPGFWCDNCKNTYSPRDVMSWKPVKQINKNFRRRKGDLR